MIANSKCYGLLIERAAFQAHVGLCVVLTVTIHFSPAKSINWYQQNFKVNFQIASERGGEEIITSVQVSIIQVQLYLFYHNSSFS